MSTADSAICPSLSPTSTPTPDERLDEDGEDRKTKDECPTDASVGDGAGDRDNGEDDSDSGGLEEINAIVKTETVVETVTKTVVKIQTERALDEEEAGEAYATSPSKNTQMLMLVRETEEQVANNNNGNVAVPYEDASIKENLLAHEMYLGLETAFSNASIRSLNSLLDSNEGSSASDASSCFTGSAASGESNQLDYSLLDRYGFIIVNDARTGIAAASSSASEAHDEDQEEQRRQEKRGRREARRAIKWIEMLKSIEFVPSRTAWPRHHRKFESRLVKGVPECLRTKVWALFLEVPPMSSPSPTYRDLYLKISGFERQIDLDIERTLRDHILFKARFSSAQVSLFKILVAYSNHDPEVGYCQGMSTIAAFLLLYFEEEMSFRILRRLMEREGTRAMFTAGFPLLFETFYVQEQLMKRVMLRLHERLEAFNITTSVYATKWYLTLFLGFPFSLATRLWDLFLFWGQDILVCASLALLKMHEALLLSLEYEACMQFLSKLPDAPIDEKRLIKLTWAIWRRVNPHYDDPLRHPPGENIFHSLRQQYGKLDATRR